MPNHGSPVPLMTFQIPPNLQTLNVIWIPEIGAQILLPLKISGKRNPSSFPNGDPIDRLASFHSLFFKFLKYPNKKGLLIKQILSFSRSTGKGASPACCPHRAPIKRASPFPEPIIHSFT